MKERKKYARVAIGIKYEPSRSHFEFFFFIFLRWNIQTATVHTYLMHELNSCLHMDALVASLKLLTTVVSRCKCKILDFSQWIIHWNDHKMMTANSQLKKMLSILLTFLLDVMVNLFLRIYNWIFGFQLHFCYEIVCLWNCINFFRASPNKFKK